MNSVELTMNENPQQSTTSTGLPLEHAQWDQPPLHIPDDAGGAYKTEWTVYRGPDRTEKINWWHGPDPRREPHDHPWADPDDGVSFESTILRGGYTETRYHRDETGNVTTEQRTYRQGDVNVMPANVYHTVDEVLPGTVTRMVCRHATPGNAWGLLIDGQHRPAPKDPMFIEAMRALNPHKRPAGAMPEERAREVAAAEAKGRREAIREARDFLYRPKHATTSRG